MDGMAASALTLVSAIMPARGRPAMAAAAVECWRRQTWPNTELLILDDADCPAFPEMATQTGGKVVEAAEFGAQAGCGGLLACNWPDSGTQAEAGTPQGKIHYFPLPKRLTIGAKRNLGCLLASGEYICHVDSDDHSSPNRIAEQMAEMQKTGKHVAGFHSMLFTDGSGFWRYICPVFAGLDGLARHAAVGGCEQFRVGQF